MSVRGLRYHAHTGQGHEAVRRALDHVAALSIGAPLDPRLRLTMNFHPDRVANDRPILRRMADDGVYR